jgi:hypothetical protein
LSAGGQVLAAQILVGCGVVVAVTTGATGDVFAIGLMLAGLCLANVALSARKKQVGGGGSSGRLLRLGDGVLVLVALSRALVRSYDDGPVMTTSA